MLGEYDKHYAALSKPRSQRSKESSVGLARAIFFGFGIARTVGRQFTSKRGGADQLLIGLVLVVGLTVPAWEQAVAACGADGQRACCFFEGTACQSGLTEVNGCSGDCGCGDTIFFANSHCRQATPCGGDGQRACCGGELISGVLACAAGLYQVSGCTGDCFCGGLANPFSINSSGTCKAVSPCGGDGQRACCLGEASFGPCQDGLTEVNGCDVDDCTCSGGAASSNSHCRQATPCGGNGQRACCGGELIDNVRSCVMGLAEIGGCSGDCFCGGSANPFAISSSGICIAPTPCGGENQRACCLFEGPICQSGLTAIPGCTGDCFCNSGAVASDTCVRLEGGNLPQISQPGTNVSEATGPRTCNLRGYADLHVHMFADTAHGGGVLAGEPYDPTNDDVNVALRPDYGTHRDLVNNVGAELPVPSCPPWIADCGTKLFHGDHTLIDDPLGFGTGDGTKSNLGAPVFSGWPTWHNTTHQQMYYKWLKRAYLGGLRLMTMLAVTNEALCLSNKRIRGTDCADSMVAIDEQLAAAEAFEAFLDAQSGGPGMGWFRIVRTPGEARQAIADGKLAVVLGIEVDNLFNCHWDDRDDLTGPCSPAGVREKVQEYYDRGVRHVFPIHNFNNAFGGPATWQDAIAVGNRASAGHWWSFALEADGVPSPGYEISDCGNLGYGFKLSCFMQSLVQLLGFPSSVIPLTDPIPCYEVAATCNPLGLTARGRDLVEALMDEGMIIDVDHMSIESLKQTIAMAQVRNYPLVASHVQFFDLNEQDQRHERMRTRAELEAIRDLGGMVAAMLKDDGQDGLGGKGKKVNIPYLTSPSGHFVADSCRHSSTTFAQALQYAIDVMGGPVALGSDFNGIAGNVGPRFGPNGCGGFVPERAWQYRFGDRLTYPFDLPEPGFGTIDRQISGGKTFDFNVDGLAHVGLLPDLVADLVRVGLPAQYIDKLFGSAEEYIRVWERASGEQDPVQNVACLSVSVDADATCTADASVATHALQESPSLNLAQSPAGPYPLGTTQVELSVSSVESCTTKECTGAVTVVDSTPPPLTCPTIEAAECSGPTTTVNFDDAFVGADNCGESIAEGCLPLPGSEFPLGDTPVSCSARDGAGNRATCATTVAVVDTTPPEIACPAPQSLECTGGNGATATPGSANASDICGGVSVTEHATAHFHVGTTPLHYVATDDVGLTASCSSNIVVVDTVPPEITCPADVVLECGGPHGANFTPGSASATDTCGDVSVSDQPNADFPLGNSLVTHEATDDVGLTASCTSNVLVVDTTPPAISSASASPATLWPPNHNMIAVDLAVDSMDVCDGAPAACRITAVRVNQSVAGDPFGPAWHITGDLSLQLRATRGGSNKAGRRYSIDVDCEDAAGNVSDTVIEVVVPHNAGGR